MTPHSDPEETWLRIAGALRSEVGERTFGLWLEPLRATALLDGALVLDGPPEVLAWVGARLSDTIAAAAERLIGEPVRVEFGDGAPAASQPAPGRAETDVLNPRFTFEQFVIGPSNRLAHAAALSVAEMPAQAYNPLFIYGAPGLGKTHLLHSIANYVRAFGGGLRVRYATAEEFTNAFLAALAGRDLDAFKARFRQTDVLLLDDVQFLERKARTEEELFHTFNALYDTGSQLVISSDRLPAYLGGLEARLRERFAAGLVTDISSPPHSTRLAILRMRAAHDSLQFDDAVLETIATHVTTNVRALEGTLIRVVAYASLTGRTIDVPLAEHVISRLGVPLAAEVSPTIPRILDATCEHFGLTREQLISRSRAERVAWPRHTAMYLARELTDHSLPQIAREFGGRDHTTVLHACRRVTDALSSQPAAFRDVEALTQRLTSAR